MVFLSAPNKSLHRSFARALVIKVVWFILSCMWLGTTWSTLTLGCLEMTSESKFPGEWPFEDEPRVAVFTTTHVVRTGKPILYVSHDADDGAWQFHSGDPVSPKDMMILALEEVLEIEPTIASLANLPLGYYATREDPSSAWMIRKKPADP